MDKLDKVSSLQLYAFWKNLSVGLISIVFFIVLSVTLPYYFSPIIALITAAFVYTVLYSNKLHQSATCLLVTYAIFYCLVTYSFLLIIINILYIWGFIRLPAELTFFNKPFIPTLSLNPVCFIVLSVVYLRRKRLSICVNCKLQRGDINERGKIGYIITKESTIQLKNLIALFFVLSVVTWGYYIYIYSDTDINARDWYVFIWVNVLAFIFDELYFIYRYFNIYLDLKDHGEIMSADEERNMTARTYLRYYVVCENDIYLADKIETSQSIERTVLDTPFITKRNSGGVSTAEVISTIRNMTGVRDGELRFFFGRHNVDMDKLSLLRYFYFLSGTKADYPTLNQSGRWFDFEEVKKIYSFNPSSLSTYFVSDITRMATVILTQKIFNEKGYRRSKLKSYRPSFNLIEIQKNRYDFQDEKWIKISMFNSDVPLYGLKKMWNGLFRRNDENPRVR